MTRILEHGQSLFSIPGETPEQHDARLNAAADAAPKLAELIPKPQRISREIADLVGEPMLYGGIDAMRAAHETAAQQQAARVEHHMQP